MNAGWNIVTFSICKIIQDVLQIDTNLSDQLKITVNVQVFCPTSLLTHTRNAISPGKEMIMSTGSQMLPGVPSKQLSSRHQKTENFQRNRNKCLHLNSVRTCIYRTHAHKNFSVNLIFPARKCNFKSLMLLFIMQL